MKRIPSLDGLRAIAILLVIFGHLVWRHHGPSWASAYANTGVRIFFVISGFLITTLLLKEKSRTASITLRDFYTRRAYRILPAMLVYLLILCAMHWHELRWFDVAAVSFYLVNFDRVAPWFIGHLWSLSVEEQFYFLWPGVLKKWHQHRVAILIGVVAFSPIFSIAAFALKVRGGAYGTFPSVADNLAVGCLLAVFIERLPKISRAMAAIMLALVVLIPQFPGDTPLRTAFMLLVLWPLLHISIAGLILHVIQNPYKLLNGAVIVWIGQISYSLYLWQQPFCWNPKQGPIGYSLIMTFGLACLSYYFVERPFLRYRDATRPRSMKEIALQPLPAPTGD